MSYNPQNINGQATMANSSPVTIASDQSVLPVGGFVASGATDSGNPIKAGGKFNSTLPTYTDGQRFELQSGSRGSLNVQLMGAGSTTGAAASTAGADAVSNSTTGVNVYTLPRVFNGTTWDRPVSVQGAADTISGVGLSAYGGYVYNGASWEKMRGDLGDASAATGLLVNNALLYNGSTYDRQRGDTTAGSWVNVKGGFSPSGTVLNTYATRITANTTTTPTSSTAYISSITITTEVGGTTSTVTIRDKQGTPQVLVNGLTTTAASLAPTVINFQTPVKMTSGIDIITAGAVAGTVDVWINYYA